MNRRICLLVTASVALTTFAVQHAPASRSVPPNATNAQGWLGTWKIPKLGTLRLDGVVVQHTDDPTIAGGHTLYTVTGRWIDPEGRSLKFEGALDPRDRLSLGASVDTPDGPDDDDIRLFRDATRISHGYWTHYVVGKPPRNHHPLTGALDEPAFKVGFRFTQDDGKTRMGGAGTLVWLEKPDRLALGGSVGKTRVFVIQASRRMTIDVAGGRYSDNDADTELLLEGSVRASDDP